MDARSAHEIEERILSGHTMRVGRKLRRTLYLHDPEDLTPDNDVVVGIVDSEYLAEVITQVWNERP